MLEQTAMEARVMEIARPHLVRIPTGFDVSMNLIKAGALDSLDVLDISVSLEREFGIDFSDTEINPRNFSTVQAMASLVCSKLHHRRVGGLPR
jgi:acyl carrier protein